MATKVLIIAGGLTHERDVSVRSGRRVANILTQCGYEVRISDVDASLAEAIETFSPDVVWPLVHGSIGEDGSLQSFLEWESPSWAPRRCRPCSPPTSPRRRLCWAQRALLRPAG